MFDGKTSINVKVFIWQRRYSNPLGVSGKEKDLVKVGMQELMISQH